MTSLIKKYVNSHDNAVSFNSLGTARYLSTLAVVNGVIGNSSSGLLEAPSLRVGTVNIGDRQRGRIQVESIISCEPNRLEIQTAIMKLLSADFQDTVQKVVSPFGLGGASTKIVDCFKKIKLAGIEVKIFFDLQNSVEDMFNVR